MREWLLCDLLAFLLVVSFLNLRSAAAKPEAYTGSFWDLLNLVLFFGAFWLSIAPPLAAAFSLVTRIWWFFRCCC